MRLKSMPPWGHTLLPVWAGQAVSLVGSGLSEFALSLWVFQHTQSVTQFAFVLLFRTLPAVLLSPLAGVLVDRWDRKKAMLLSDSGSALCSLVIAALFLSDRLQPWQVCVATAVSAAFGALQAPAYLSAISSLVPKESLGRVNGLRQLSQAVADVLVPTLAAALVTALGVSGVILIDFATFVVAVLTLAFQSLPRLPQSPEVYTPGLARSFADGVHYLRSRRGLSQLLSFNLAFSFFSGMLNALLIPLFLGVTSVQGMGLVLTVAGGGLLAGSLLMSALGDRLPHVKSMLGASLAFGMALLGMGAGSNVIWVAACAFLAHFCYPFSQGASQALWQAAVDQDIQGRVFAIRQMGLRIAQPVALLLAGLAADFVFEPLMQPGGSLGRLLGTWMGTGSGRGAAVLVALGGLAVAAVSLWFRFARALRQMESGAWTREEI